MTVRANKPAFNIREKLKELTQSIGLKGRELMRAATVQDARDLVSAGRKNMIINGGMAVAQRGTSVVGNSNATFYGPDRFAFFRGVLNTSITGTQQTVTDLPGHDTSFRVTCSGNASLIANSDGWIRYTVEDKDFARINWKNGSNKFVTLSFYAKSNRTGQFSCSLNSGSFTVAKNINTFTLETADTWKKITFTYPAPSTFTESGNIGARIYWGMGTGTTYYTSNPNIGWLYSNTKIGAVGDTQIYGDDGAYFEITGVQLEEGKNATDFEYRSYGEELALCQRYFQRNENDSGQYTAICNISNYSTTTVYGAYHLLVPMRVSPTSVNVSSLSHFSIINRATDTNPNPTAMGIDNGSGKQTLRFYATATGLPVGIPGFIQMNNTSAYIDFNAEL